MNVEVMFLDLDGTLYPHENGMWDEIAFRMETYMNQIIGIPMQLIPNLRKAYFEKYGTTLKGLQTNYEIDPEDYLTYVHDIPVSDFIKPDDKLRNILMELPQPKWVLTNSDKTHSNRVLAALGIEDLFLDILGVTEMNFHNKPDSYVFNRALEFAGNPAPNKCLFVDDIPKNLQSAKEIGFITVLVGNRQDNQNNHFTIANIHDLQKVMKNL